MQKTRKRRAQSKIAKVGHPEMPQPVEDAPPAKAEPAPQTTTANSLDLFQMTGLMFAGHGSFGDFRNQYKRRRNHDSV